MKKLWNRLFKKNSNTLTPLEELSNLVNNIERDEKGKWVIPVEETKLPKDFTDQLKKFKEEINKASDIAVAGTVKKPAPKKPATKKATPAEAKKPVAKKPVAKKPTPKKPKAD